MPTARMMNVRTFSVRLNRSRTSKNPNVDKRNSLWLTEEQLVTGAEKFIKVNGYHRIDYNRTFNEGGYHFTSLIVGYRNAPQAGPKRKHQEVQHEQQILLSAYMKSTMSLINELPITIIIIRININNNISKQT
jgi:hypothetical protein